MILAITLYVILFAIAAFGPLRWAFVAYLLLSTIDFPGDKSAVGMLNAAKGIILPLYLLWRLRGYAGHRTIIAAPVAWVALVMYAGIAAFWSIFPLSALKLVGHMTGSLLICFVFLRATKGGFISQRIIVPVAVGCLFLAAVCRIFEPNWSTEPGRFNSFTTAQGFASLLGALFCLALCAESLRTRVRVLICSALAIALVFNGSRIWFIGISIAALIALLVSAARPWIKIFVVGFVTILVTVLVQQSQNIIDVLAANATSNRIAAAATAFYLGNSTSRGLGTLNFRREITALAIQQIERSSPTELIFGHGTCNAAVITGSLFKGYSKYVDPNRMVHDEWLRIFYEWGLLGFVLWSIFACSLILFALRGLKLDGSGNSKPLLVYLPAFLLAFAGENFLAGAGTAMSTGLLLLVGLAGISHRGSLQRASELKTGPESSRYVALDGLARSAAQ